MQISLLDSKRSREYLEHGRVLVPFAPLSHNLHPAQDSSQSPFHTSQRLELSDFPNFLQVERVA